MKERLHDVLEEFKMFYSSKGIDVLLPPLIFTLFNIITSLKVAVITCILLAVLIFMIRVVKKDNPLYALGGLIAVIIASSFAYFSDNASHYYLPKLVTSGGLVFISLISLLVKKPITLWTSHLTRHWPIAWYMRSDIYPAYNAVARIWLLLFFVRFVLIAALLLKADLLQLSVLTLILGTPFTIAILTISYLYGLWYLKRLKGPSVEEFINDVLPPWNGQSKGF